MCCRGCVGSGGDRGGVCVVGGHAGSGGDRGRMCVVGGVLVQGVTEVGCVL